MIEGSLFVPVHRFVSRFVENKINMAVGERDFKFFQWIGYLYYGLETRG